jgi:hypothetical protein
MPVTRFAERLNVGFEHSSQRLNVKRFSKRMSSAFSLNDTDRALNLRREHRKARTRTRLDLEPRPTQKERGEDLRTP